MPPLIAFLLGALAGLGIGALVVLALLRATGRITGARPASVLGLVVDGLRPGERADGVAVQRGLARHLARTSSRTASGRRVAATSIALHVSPQDLARVDEALGREAAVADLAEFYLAHARRHGWHVSAEPDIDLVRDISLKPRQVFAHAETVADLGAVPVADIGAAPGARAAARPEPEPQPSAPRRPAAAAAPWTGPATVRPRSGPVPVAPRPDEAVTDVLPSRDQAVTDVLPRQDLAGEDAGTTRSYPVDAAELLAPGDLVVVHGTAVRTVPRSRRAATIGRARHNDIVVDAPGVQRDHVRLELREDGWWVVPVAAAATRLDGRAVAAPVALGGQGLLELGRGARIRLSAEPAA